MQMTTPFPEAVAYNSVGGRGFATDVVSFAGGGETRNSPREQAYGAWDVAKGCVTEADRAALITFFTIARGKLHTFPFRDLGDYKVSASEGVTLFESTNAYQLYKRYQNADGTHDRIIRIPKQGTITVYKNAVAQTEGVAAGNWILNYQTGFLAATASVTKNISGITQANPGKVTTSTAHGFTNGQTVYLSAIAGMTQLNGITATVTVVDADEFAIGINTTGYTAWSSGGTAALYWQAGDAITWSGQFYCKCRFDIDRLSLIHQPIDIFQAQTIPVCERDE